MIHTPGNRYFDISAFLALGLAAFLLLSLPGGCWSDQEQDEESGDGEDVEAVAEPSAPPTMEIVEPEPGDIVTSDGDDEDGDDSAEAESSDADGEGSGDDEDDQEQEAPDDGTYVVQEGDTLYEIAVEFGITMEELMQANGIEDPNALQVGQELQIP